MTEDSSNKKAPAGKPGRGQITGDEPIIYNHYSDIEQETTAPNLSDQETAIKPQEAGPLSGALFTRLQPVQAAALDLYHRGINVFPLPSVRELLNYAAAHQKTPTKRPYPYIDEMYKYRLHVCGPDCERKAQETGKRCMPVGQTFIDLFGSYAIGAYNSVNIGAAMGRISNNLFCIDCDNPKQFELTIKRLDHKDIKYWAYTGSKGGGILMRLLEGEAANKENTGDHIEIKGNRHFMVLPPSLHIAGVFYQWITTEPNKLPPGEMPPLVELKQLDFLGVELAKNKSGRQWQEPELYGLPAAAARLSRRTRELLGRGTYKGETIIESGNGEYHGRNDLLIDVCVNLKGGGIPYDTAEAWVLAAIGKFYPPFTKRDALERLNWAYYKAEGITTLAEYKAAKKADDKQTGKTITNDTLTRAIEFANNYRWSGRTAQADKAVFIACCKRAAIEGDTFRATSREIAELANMGRAAATRAKQRLCGQTSGKTNNTPHVLQLAEQYNTKTNTAGNKYSLNISMINDIIGSGHVNTSNYGFSNSGINMPTRFEPVLPTTPAEQDIFSSVGIGRIAWQIWQLLITEPQPNNKTKIATGLQLDRTSVRRAIDRLIKYRLIEPTAEGMLIGIAKTDAQLQEIAAIIDGDKTRQVFGRSDKRKREHDLERAKRLHDLIYKQRTTWAKNYGLQQPPPAKKGKKRGQA